MFCPKCASQNVEGAHFCRSCGANISLVPQALTGQLPVASEDRSNRQRRKRRNHQPSREDGVQSVITGFGFLAVAVALAFFGRPIGAQIWWFWLLFPGFGMLGKGISEIMRANKINSSLTPAPQQIAYVAPPEPLPASNTAELRPPVASVTERTTRHLGTEAATRHFEQNS